MNYVGNKQGYKFLVARLGSFQQVDSLQKQKVVKEKVMRGVIIMHEILL